MNACKNCLHWRANMQRTVPAEFVPETRKFLWFKYTTEPDMFYNFDRQWTLVQNNSGWCRRFPESVRTKKSYTCGEHQPTGDA